MASPRCDRDTAGDALNCRSAMHQVITQPAFGATGG
jgi:hypothetical protein